MQICVDYDGFVISIYTLAARQTDHLDNIKYGRKNL